MNNLTYTVSTVGQDGTTIYLVPTNSRHTISFSEVNAMYLHILNSQGKQVAVFPVNYDDDGIYWTLGQLGELAGDTYAFYLELKYSDTYSEYYPDNSVKYFTVIDDENAPKADNGLSLVNIFNAEYNGLKPIIPPQSPDGGELYDDDIFHNVTIAQTVTLPDDQPARVEVNKNTIKFYIPKGSTGESAYQLWLDAGHAGTETDFINSLKGPKGDVGPEGQQGPQGPKGDTGGSAYQAWLDAGNIGTEAQFLASLKGPKGDTGDTGPAGATGPQGPQGDTGPVGPQGPKGDTGATGSQGPQGIQGPVGPVGPQGSRGYNVWAMKMTAGGNVSGRNITDLYNASATNLPEVNDLVVQPDGNVYSVTNVVKDTTSGSSDGGGTFDLGPAIFSIKGDKGNDAVINVISQAEYDALTDKSGVYFIEG